MEVNLRAMRTCTKIEYGLTLAICKKSDVGATKTELFILLYLYREQILYVHI